MEIYIATKYEIEKEYLGKLFTPFWMKIQIFNIHAFCSLILKNLGIHVYGCLYKNWKDLHLPRKRESMGVSAFFF